MQRGVYPQSGWRGYITYLICSLPLSPSSHFIAVWFIHSLPCLLLCLSLGLAHLCSLLDWDSMYPEQVRTLGCSAFDSTMVYFPLTASSSWIPPQLSTCHKSRSTLACWRTHCWLFQYTFSLNHFCLWQHWQQLCALLCVWYGVGQVWVFLCGIYLASILTAPRCVIHRDPCLHTSEDAQGTGLTVHSYITDACCVQSLLNSC